MTTGITAARSLAVVGTSASLYGQEIDLATDGLGDLLQIDPAGDVLIVTTGLLVFTGGTAAQAAADPAVALETEGWIALQTEDGQILETEGS